jgi:hypothetical protein
VGYDGGFSMKINKDDSKKKADDKAIWKTKFKHDVNNPNCEHCKFGKAENSIPSESFIITDEDKNGKTLPNKTITQIKIHRGRYDECVGWSF